MQALTPSSPIAGAKSFLLATAAIDEDGDKHSSLSSRRSKNPACVANGSDALCNANQVHRRLFHETACVATGSVIESFANPTSEPAQRKRFACLQLS